MCLLIGGNQDATSPSSLVVSIINIQPTVCVCVSCSEWKLQCVGVTVCGRHSEWEAQYEGGAVCGSCGLWELLCVGVAVCGGRLATIGCVLALFYLRLRG